MRQRPTSALPALFLAAALASATTARAEGETPGFAPVADAAGGFGAVGQIVLSLGATADEHFFFHKSGGAWELQLAPAADYFIAPHISVGGVVAYDHASGGGANGAGLDTVRIGARAGYAYAFNDRFGVWPMAGLRFDYAHADHGSNTSTWLPIYVPFMFHPAPHFFVGAGPSVQVHLTGDVSTVWGIDSMLGGWF
jgi:hypothetical protein